VGCLTDPVCVCVVLGLSAHVNQFMGFFYVADRFPFIMSILTLLILVPLWIVEFIHSGNVRTAKPQFELAWVGALLFAWTGANAFSTSRWSDIRPSDCASIPIEENPEFLAAAKTWCHEIQVLRAFVWMEWAMLTLIFVGLVMFCVGQSRRGSRHVWTTPIGRFDPLTCPDSIKPIYPGISGQDIRSTKPNSSWNPDAKAPMPTYAAPSSYAFGNDGTAQMGSESATRRVVSGDVLGYQPDPFSSEPGLIPTPPSGPSPDQWQQFPKTEQYSTMNHAY